MAIVPVDTEQRVSNTVAVLTLAFSDDPVTRWLYPTPARVLAGFPTMIRAFSRSAFENATARIADDGAGAAVWLPPGVHPDEDALGAAVEDLDPAIRDEAAVFFTELEHFHPGDRHWYLPLIAVEGARRGTGIGSALLAEALVRCDADHATVYLESTNPRNVPFYERHGFFALGTVQVGSSPVMTPMTRDPR